MTPREKAERLHKKVNTFILSCIGSDGYPLTKAVVPGKHRESLSELYFCTNTSSKFVAEINKNPKAGVQKHEMLLKLHQNLTTALQQNGIECDKRKYSPHITLGREIVTKVQPREIEPFGETVAKIEFMKSERIDGKLTYTAIYDKGAESTHEN